MASSSSPLLLKYDHCYDDQDNRDDDEHDNHHDDDHNADGDVESTLLIWVPLFSSH